MALEANIYYLKKSELQYELKIRGFEDEAAEVKDLRYILRKYVREGTTPRVELANQMTEQDQLEVTRTLDEIQSLVSDFPGRNATQSENRIKAKLLHLRARVQRYTKSEITGFAQFKSSVLNKLELIEAKLARAVSAFAIALNTSLQSPTREREVSDDDQSEPEELGNDPLPVFSSTTFPRVSGAPHVPVYKWGVTFDGRSGRDLVTFLERVEELRIARNVSKQELFQSAIDLFSGAGLAWYRSIKSKVNSWDDLVKALKQDFLPEDYDDVTWDRVRARKQRENESAIIFISEMEQLFAQLTTLPPENERLRQIRKNLLPHIVTQLCLVSVSDISHLSQLCKKIESVFPKKVSRSGKEIFVVKPGEPKLESREAGFKGKCWNCGRLGHGFAQCKEKRKRFCYRCGSGEHISTSCSKFSTGPKN